LFYFIASGANTGAVTLNIDGLGAKAITRDGSTALAAGDINSGEIVVVIYDGTRFQMINAANSFGNTTINGTLTVTGNTGLQANVSVTSALSVGGTFAVTGAATLGSTLAVTGKSDLPTVSTASANAAVAVITDLSAAGASITSANVGTAVVTTGTVTNLTATSASVASVNAGVALLTTATVTNLTATGASIASANLGNAVISALTLTGVSVASANVGVANITDLRAVGASVTSANLGTAVVTNGTVTNLTATSASVASVNAAVALLTTATVTTLTASGASIASANIGNLQFTAASIASINAGVAVINNLTATSASIASANVGTAVITTGTVTNLTSTAASVASANVGVALITTGTVTTLTATGASVASANVGTAVVTGLTVTNASVASLNAGTATITTGNLTFSSTAQRITGDFSNATESNRLAFQSSTTNGGTRVNILTNGTGTASSLDVFGVSDPTNAAVMRVRQSGTESQLLASITGTGTYLPMTFYTGGSERVRIDTSGGVGIATATVSTNFRQEIVGAAGSNTGPASSGTTQSASAVMRIRPGGGFTATLDIGQGGGTGSWLQSTDTSNLATTYPLLLNPVGGNVGIGTASPVAKLDIISGTARVYISNQSASGFITAVNTTNTAYAPLAINGSELVLKTGDAARATIDSSGNVGIGGTAGADTRVQVLGTAPSSGGQSRGYLTTQTIPSSTTTNFIGFGSVPATQAASFTCSQIYHYYAAQGSLGAGSAVTTQYGYFADSTLTGATNNYGFYSNIASGSNRWNFYAAGTAQNYFAGNTLIGTTTSGDGRLEVSQSANNKDVARFFSTGSGDVGQRAIVIGKYDNNSTTSQIFVQFSIANNSVTSGQINANGANAAAFGTWSDARLKENIVDLPPQLANICALRPVEFDYKAGGHQIGFIAQEMQEVYADSVGENKDGMLTITGWSKTEARLVKAIQELAARVAELEAK
jgi:hypothetical protein